MGTKRIFPHGTSDKREKLGIIDTRYGFHLEENNTGHKKIILVQEAAEEMAYGWRESGRLLRKRGIQVRP